MKTNPSRRQPADFTIHQSGSVSLFAPITESARAWLCQHCPAGDDHQYIGDSLAVEHRFIAEIIRLAIRDGLMPSPTSSTPATL
jgi:hypothetical protein